MPASVRHYYTDWGRVGVRSCAFFHVLCVGVGRVEMIRDGAGVTRLPVTGVGAQGK